MTLTLYGKPIHNAVATAAGLGVPIHTALGEGPFKTELIAAGGLTIALALLVDGLLVLAQRALTPWARAG